MAQKQQQLKNKNKKWKNKEKLNQTTEINTYINARMLLFLLTPLLNNDNNKEKSKEVKNGIIINWRRQNTKNKDKIDTFPPALKDLCYNTLKT